MLDHFDHDALRDGLRTAGADSWCIFDFHGLNPVLGRVVGSVGMGTRRLFVFLTPGEEPVAVAHRIELQPLADFPGRVIPYSRWEELHAALRPLVQGRTLAMEVSPHDAVPYLDRVPHGVVQLLESFGARIVPSPWVSLPCGETQNSCGAAGSAEQKTRKKAACITRRIF